MQIVCPICTGKFVTMIFIIFFSIIRAGAFYCLRSFVVCKNDNSFIVSYRDGFYNAAKFLQFVFVVVIFR